MQYNFDEIHDRKDNQSIKWDVLKDKFGSEDVIPLWVADMDFQTSEAITNAIIHRAEQGIYGYTTLHNEYYEAFINWCQKRHQWDVKKEEIIFSPGVVLSIIMTINALTEKNDKIIIQPPVYGPFKRSIEDHGRQVLINPLKVENDCYTMDFEDLEKQIDNGGKVLILCSPHNPIGRVWSTEELEILAEITIRRNLLVIADEIHSDLVLKNIKHIPFASLSEALEKQVITFMSPSKTFNLAGLHSSVIVCKHEATCEKVRNEFEKMDISLNNCFGQVAFEAAYNDGEEWLEQLLEYIEGNIDYVIEFFEEHLHEIKIQKPDGTYLLWLDCRALGFTHHQLEQFMIQKAGVAFTDGSFFGDEGLGFMRMNVACSRQILEKALHQIEKALRSLRM